MKMVLRLWRLIIGDARHLSITAGTALLVALSVHSGYPRIAALEAPACLLASLAWLARRS